MNVDTLVEKSDDALRKKYEELRSDDLFSLEALKEGLAARDPTFFLRLEDLANEWEVSFEVGDAEKRKLAVKLYNDKNYSVNQVCQMMGISKPTLYKYVRVS